MIKADILVDVINETCPIPLVEMRKALMKADDGTIVEIVGNHASSGKEIPLAVESLGLTLLDVNNDSDGIWHIFIRK